MTRINNHDLREEQAVEALTGREILATSVRHDEGLKVGSWWLVVNWMEHKDI